MDYASGFSKLLPPPQCLYLDFCISKRCYTFCSWRGLFFCLYSTFATCIYWFFLCWWQRSIYSTFYNTAIAYLNHLRKIQSIAQWELHFKKIHTTYSSQELHLRHMPLIGGQMLLLQVGNQVIGTCRSSASC